MNRIDKEEARVLAAKAAETAIEKDITLEFDGKKVRMKRPTLRTLIAVSAEICKLPEFAPTSGKEITSALAYAKESKPLAKIIAMLMCGVKKDVCFWHKFSLWRTQSKVMDNYTPKELNVLLGRLFAEMNLTDFFLITTSLSEIVLTMPTRGVVKTTQSGQ